jgi:UDP-2,4-diacetamido-2,4,6-trideoxy-beta-L-altropyranose hydrolase
MYTSSCVAIRVDAAMVMGTGHLRRCLSLAQALLERGAKVHLLVRQLDDVAAQVLQKIPAFKDFKIHWLPRPNFGYFFEEGAPPNQHWSGVAWSKDVSDVIAVMQNIRPEWMIVDHYAFDEKWHGAVCQSLGCKLLVIDDLADRSLDTDVLLDQNWDSNHEGKYIGRLRRDPAWLTGPTFALLDKIYYNTLPYQFKDEVKSIGIFMGGTDPEGASLKALYASRKSGFLGPVEVATISANPHLPSLRNYCSNSVNTMLTIDEPNLAHFFFRHDLHIGAGGSATWERCCMGAPTIAMALAENQRTVLEPLRGMDVLEIAEGFDERFQKQIHALIANPELRRVMYEKSRRLVDGAGVYRVANFLLTYD